MQINAKFAFDYFVCMKTIGEYISELLYVYDCVTVPTLGAFVAGRVPASVDNKRGVLLPPRKEIVFNRLLSYNDGLLASHIALTEGVSFETASISITREVSEMMRKLRRGNIVMLPNLGTLSFVGEELLFSADASRNYLTDSYGFAPVAVVDRLREVRNREIFSVNNIRRVVASAVLVFGLLLISQNVRDGQVEQSQASFANFFTPVAAQQTEQAQVIDNESVNEISENQKFHIIVGSFISQKEADKFISSLRQKGVDGLEKIQNGKRVRVSVASFATHEEAVKQNRIVRTISGFEKAWVWEN